MVEMMSYKEAQEDHDFPVSSFYGSITIRYDEMKKNRSYIILWNNQILRVTKVTGNKIKISEHTEDHMKQLAGE